ncbi:MAG: outer membrane protein assembly factor BamA [Gammaproteobacteria bacterium]|nr:outer membrane protein assembly factor BamA [Gammaproteobacteria bacterium]
MSTRFSHSALFTAMMLAASSAFAAPFVVDKVVVQGAEKVGVDTVLSYVPVRAGQSIDLEAQGEALVKSVYGSGLFEDVEIGRAGDSLVVRVVQRAIISSVDVTGYRRIGKDVIDATLAEIDMQGGRPLNRAILDKLRKRISEIYAQAGYYQTDVKVSTVALDDDRVDVTIAIEEGDRAQIKTLAFTGNTAFDDETLSGIMGSGPTSNPFSSRDVFIREKLKSDLRQLLEHYRENGYAAVEIVSADVSLNDAKDEVYINISLNEGNVFQFGNVALNALGLDPAIAQQVAALSNAGQFQQSRVLAARDMISDWYGDQGYAFAKIDIVPQVNPAGTVDLAFNVDSGTQVKVRFIEFAGNHSTNDRTLRLEMRQNEGELFNPAKLRLSQKRIGRLSYINDVGIDLVPVEGAPGLVDLRVIVNEGLSGDFMLSGGYGSDGWVLGGSIKRNNLFGTGQSLGAKIDISESTQRLSITHYDPYFTDSGVSQSISMNVFKNDTSKTESSADWIQNLAEIELRYGMPVGEFGRLSGGLEVGQTDFTKTTNTPQSVSDELDQFGTDFTYVRGSVTASYDDRDNIIFPTEGQDHSLTLEVTQGENVEYNKVRYEGATHVALNDTFVASGKVGVATGSGMGDREKLPFFDRYYAGGIRSVRGFKTNSLGPRYANSIQARGGDFSVNASMALSMQAPSESLKDSVRLSAFVDTGNVFDTRSDFDSGELRSSAGIGVVWITPVGPLTFSYAKPLETNDDDRLQSFQFTIGSAF